MPTLDDSVESVAVFTRVNPVGAAPFFEILPRADDAAAVPPPENTPPADSIVRPMELMTVPVTVKLPVDVSCAWAAEVNKPRVRARVSAARIGAIFGRIWEVSCLPGGWVSVCPELARQPRG